MGWMEDIDGENNEKDCAECLDPAFYNENVDQQPENYDPNSECRAPRTAKVMHLTQEKWVDCNVLETDCVRARQGVVAESPYRTLSIFLCRNHGPSLPVDSSATVLGGVNKCP